MTTKTHISAGFALAAPLMTVHNLYLAPIIIMGATFPDVDMKIGLKHRGFTHSLLCLFLASYGLWVADRNVAIAFLLGYGSHLILDMFTMKGVKLFFPLKCSFCLKLCKTDGTFDRGLGIVSIVIICVRLIQLIQPNLQL
ncbi:hypothetical protein CPJCM30710_22680 [Clostridium polyendosporum]|uniref:Inner membrane protein n=1 Tax=Clostridium polyendosporum TaxID=69208 RepID=A0A919S0K0_9CLOT|nr:metal-dependent hydrolase [Clostridium polyendosporum]GIM29602.1 hypothetical protein CPJCM30710_22680 [Clostridium polyendosporum]